VDGHGRDYLARFEPGRAFAELIDGSDKIPTWRVRHTGRFGMNALASQDIRQTDPRRQHLNPHLACLRGRDIFFDQCDHFRAAVLSDHNSHVPHVPPHSPS
jgi:hypothetical protein